MGNVPILRMMTWVEETYVEGLLLAKPARKAVAMAVIKNPLADRYKDDLGELTDIGHYLGAVLAAKARNALGIKPEEVEGIGKGCIVGEDGEVEHAAAVLHVRYPDEGFGKSFRDETNGGMGGQGIPTSRGGKVSLSSRTPPIPKTRKLDGVRPHNRLGKAKAVFRRIRSVSTPSLQTPKRRWNPSPANANRSQTDRDRWGILPQRAPR